ncbi:MAG TPA: cupin domain-containing protein [Myxococcales bacterium]|nr:cupin domain-containing protein [Myxococcales bacterium]
MQVLSLVALLAAAVPQPKTLLTSGPVKLLELVAEKPVPFKPKGAEVIVVVEGTAKVPLQPGDELLKAGDSLFAPAPRDWWLTPEPKVRVVILSLPTPAGVTATTQRNEKDTVHYRMLGGQGEVALVLDKGVVGTDAFSQSRLTLQPGAAVPPHQHKGSVEIIYVVSGKTEVTLEGKAKTLGQGEAIALPAGEQHAAKVVGTEALHLVQFYVPGGPEQRFRGGGGAGAGGSGAPDGGVSGGPKPR